ncbi:MAG: alginate lyase family protein, partial [Armatimonadetes bacterium]|nr:alginate lyase family protein [Armatimonadota bacterium]
MFIKPAAIVGLVALGLPLVYHGSVRTVGPLPDHPRLLVAQADLPALKDKIARNAWARRTLVSFRQKADAWLDRPVTLPSRGGQWSHWYSCKKHGARLRTDSPTRHICPIDGEVFTGYPYDDVVLGREHDAYADAVRTLGLVYLLTDEPKYAAKARDILLAYADRYVSYPLHNNQGREAVGGGRVTSQTLNEAIWIIRMAQGADAIWDRLSEDDRAALKTKLFYPAVVDVIQKHRMGIHNIQCWKNSAVGLVGFLYDDPALIADAIDSAHGFRAQMSKGVNADGQWWEGAWGYHFYTMDAVWPLTEAARNCGINLYGDEYKRMFVAPILLAMPDGKLPAFNDSTTATAYGNVNYEIGYARYGDRNIARAVGRARESLQSLVCGVASVPNAVETPIGSAEFPASGYTVLRSGPGTNSAWLCLKYGPHGGGHGHPDKNSFVLYAGSGVLAGDPGTAAYGVPIQSEWYRTTLAHNTIVVDESPQAAATGRAIAFAAQSDRFRGAICDAGSALAHLRFRRCALLLDDHVALFVDQITPDRDIASAP